MSQTQNKRVGQSVEHMLWSKEAVAILFQAAGRNVASEMPDLLIFSETREPTYLHKIS